jgi:hypothetical protein
MYITNWEGPPKELLDKCFQVLIGDPVKPWELKRWAIKHCKSYIWMEEVDTSDVSGQFDIVCSFYFLDDKDALMFRLKWKS